MKWYVISLHLFLRAVPNILPRTLTDTGRSTGFWPNNKNKKINFYPSYFRTSENWDIWQCQWVQHFCHTPCTSVRNSLCDLKTHSGGLQRENSGKICHCPQTYGPNCAECPDPQMNSRLQLVVLVLLWSLRELEHYNHFSTCHRFSLECPCSLQWISEAEHGLLSPAAVEDCRWSWMILKTSTSVIWLTSQPVRKTQGREGWG